MDWRTGECGVEGVCGGGGGGGCRDRIIDEQKGTRFCFDCHIQAKSG